MAEPEISVIVPAHNSEGVLELCLSALLASDLPHSAWELIIVDDASTDRTVEIAKRYTVRIIELEGPAHGPAFARNRGSEIARAPVLAFVDSDVSVAPDALRRMLDHLDRDETLTGVFGSYDDRPTAPGFVSQYRNLLHHYVHNRNAGESQSFWAGCGALRATGFRDAGCFDEIRYSKAEIEDVELGYRLRDRGYRLLLDPEIECTHHKRWTLEGMLRADFRHRGIPWMRLLLERRSLIGGGGPSLGVGEKASVALVGLSLLLLVASALLRQKEVVFGVVLCLILIALLNKTLLAWYASKRGVAFAGRTFFMVLLYHVTNVASALLGAASYFRTRRLTPSENA
ncbi:MAG TPA: glycosyltransferase [Gemmatimonadaceae bacterium]|nr:glycosyltransferase [Gemmatimonadaceae bacterium]